MRINVNSKLPITLLIIVLITVTLAACSPSRMNPLTSPIAPPNSASQPAAESSTGGALVSPLAAPDQSKPSTPQANRATVSGRVISDSSRQPIPDISVWLAFVSREGDRGAYFLDTANSPVTRTDARGYFAISNAPVGEYAILVGDPFTKSHERLVIRDEKGNARIIKAEADKIIDVGELKISE
jgi:hypothetical protein